MFACRFRDAPRDVGLYFEAASVIAVLFGEGKRKEKLDDFDLVGCLAGEPEITSA